MSLFEGKYRLTCRTASGKLRWKGSIRNGVTYQGANQVLNSAFLAGTPGPYYVGLIAQSAYTGVSINDTHGSHPGWTEWTLYSGSRSLWQPLASNAGFMASAVPFFFTLTAGGNIRGAFLANSSAKGSVSPAAFLYCTAVGASYFTFAGGDVVSGTYSVRIGV